MSTSFVTTFTIDSEESKQSLFKFSPASSGGEHATTYATALADLRLVHQQAMDFFASAAAASASAADDSSKAAGATEPKTPLLGPMVGELSEESSTEFDESEPKQARLEVE